MTDIYDYQYDVNLNRPLGDTATPAVYSNVDMINMGSLVSAGSLTAQSITTSMIIGPTPDGTGDGQLLTIIGSTGNDSNGGDGGDVKIQGGNGGLLPSGTSGPGGDVHIIGGTPRTNGDSGNVIIRAGTRVTGGADGNIQFRDPSLAGATVRYALNQLVTSGAPVSQSTTIATLTTNQSALIEVDCTAQQSGANNSAGFKIIGMVQSDGVTAGIISTLSVFAAYDASWAASDLWTDFRVSGSSVAFMITNRTQNSTLTWNYCAKYILF